LSYTGIKTSKKERKTHWPGDLTKHMPCKSTSPRDSAPDKN